jgi:hypothetical protein
MNPFLHRILCFLFFSIPAIALCQQKDSIFLYNGQVLIGDIKDISYGKLSIDDVDLKIISLKSNKIEKIRTIQEFRIETDDKHIYFGRLGRSNRSGWVDIIPKDTASFSIPITDISFMVFLGKRFLRRLSGDVSAGFSYTKSNGIGQLNFSSSAKYATKGFDNELNLSTIGSIDSSKYSRDNENAEFFSNYSLTPSWSISGLLGYQKNIELALKHRYQQLLGAGNKLIVTKNLQLLAISGISISEEKSTDNVYSGGLFEIPAMLRFNYYNFQHPDIQITTSQALYFGITQAGRIRYSGSTDFSWQLIRNFYFKITLFSNFDNMPPAESSSTTDFGMVLSVSYRF